MSKIMLIVPAEFLGVNKITASSSFSVPHIGLAYVASYLREKSHEIEVIDAEADGLSLEDLRKRIESFRPDFIGMTATSIQIREAHEVARLSKSIDPNIPTIIGGYHATAIPDRTLEEFPLFDYAVFGEGEITTYELIMILEKGKGVSGVDGIAYRKDGKVRVNKKRDPIKNLDRLPFPAFDLFHLDRYNSYFLSNPQLPISTRRGCPFRCVFCANPRTIVRERSVDNVIEEVKKDIREFGARSITIIDEFFTLKKDLVVEFCDRIIEEGLHKKVEWMCETRVDFIDRDMLKKMKESNCKTIIYGAESGNQEILDSINKRITLKQTIDATRWAKKIKMEVVSNFILGLPWETEKTIKETIRFALKTDPDFAVFATLVPFPGTEVAAMAERGEGGLRYVSRDWNDYGKHMGGSLELETVPKNRLNFLQFMAYFRFYSRPHRIMNGMRIVNAKAFPFYLYNQVKNIFNR